MCDVVTVLETHNKQPEDSLQQNLYIYLLCVIMTSHTAYPGCDFSVYKRCCTNLMTKTCSWPGGAQPVPLPTHSHPCSFGVQGAVHGSVPPLQLGMQAGNSLHTQIKAQEDWFLLTSS